jgi:predicted methyltransferase
MNQKDQVLNHFSKKKSITSWEAIQKYGITRLAAVICDLKLNHNIVTIIEKGDGKKWAKYVYMGVNK